MATYISPVSGDWAGNSSNLFVAHRTGAGGKERYHAGNDLHAANGSKAYATIGGTVLYTGDNAGYRWNATVLGDDGNIYRYATHGPLSVNPGQRVEQGQAVGTIAKGHLHFEVIPPQSPAYKTMVANPSAFIDTQWYPGGRPLSVNPAVFFGIKPGSTITAGQEIGTVPGSQELALASFTAAQQSPEQIAALQQTLADQGVYKGPIDGVWGRGTQAGFEQYAAANGVPGGTTAAAPPEPIDPTTQKLAAMMLTENRGGGNRGMMDVGSVALNRVRDTSGKWGNTLDEVLNPNHFAIRDLSNYTPEEQARAIDIATRLQAGDITDTTGGATSFLTHGTTADWAGKPGYEFQATNAGLDFYGQGQFDDEQEVAAAAPPPAAPQVAFAPVDARTKDDASTATSAAFADLPPETPAAAIPAAATRSLPAPAAPTASPAFAPITEARTKDETTYPATPRESVVQSVAGPAFAPVPTTPSDSPFPESSRDVYEKNYGTEKRETDAALAALKEPTDWAAGVDQYRPMTAFAPLPKTATTTTTGDFTGPALATPATTAGWLNPLATTAKPEGPAIATPVTAANQPNPTSYAVPENVAKKTPVANTSYPAPAVTEERKNPLKGVGKAALNFFTGGIPGLVGGLLFNNSGSGGGLFSGFGGDQVFKPTSGGPSGTTPNGWNYQTGSGFQGQPATQFTSDGRTYTYNDTTAFGGAGIGGWSK